VRHYASVDLKHLDLLMREIDHNLAADKAHLGRTKMTRWGIPPTNAGNSTLAEWNEPRRVTWRFAGQAVLVSVIAA
jgi:hypothetical protein